MNLSCLKKIIFETQKWVKQNLNLILEINFLTNFYNILEWDSHNLCLGTPIIQYSRVIRCWN
jgi:hypothetical protein